MSTNTLTRRSSIHASIDRIRITGTDTANKLPRHHDATANERVLHSVPPSSSLGNSNSGRGSDSLSSFAAYQSFEHSSEPRLCFLRYRAQRWIS